MHMHIRMPRYRKHHVWLRFDQSEAFRLEVKALNNYLYFQPCHKLNCS